MAWLDWTLPPPPIRLITVGDTVREVGWRQEARYRQWRDTVLFQQGLIEEQCARAGHCAESATAAAGRPVERVLAAGGVL
jgi:hypothetical protein